MKYNFKKIITKISIIILFILICTSFVYFSKAFTPDRWKPLTLAEDEDVIKKGNIIIGGIQAIGSLVSVGTLVVMGIRYMMGSIEEKAEQKKTLIYYVIGAILVFAISNISAMIYNWASTLNT